MRIRAAGDTVITHPLVGAVAADTALGLLGGADLGVANLEVALTDSGYPAEKVSVLRSAPAMAAEYRRLGVDLWSVATNHALDYGIPGLQQTLSTLDAHGLRYAGAGTDIDDAVAPVYVTARSGERIAFLNFCSVLPPGAGATTQRPGLAPIRVGQSYEFDGVRLDEQPGSPPTVHSWAQEVDAVRAERAIAAARADADLVVVALHWGVAWCFLPANQGPLAEYQRPLAHRLIDAGAKVIIGHHAHAVHPVEFHGDGVVLYSTGNFLFHDTEKLPESDRRITPPLKPVLRSGPWFESAVFDITVSGSSAGSGIEVTPIPIELDAHGEPVHASPAAATHITDYLYTSSRELDARIRRTENGALTV